MDNKQLMYVIGVIEDAIENEKKISFIYNDYDTDFKLRLRREKRYIMNPYQLIINNGRYYLLEITITMTMWHIAVWIGLPIL